MKFNPNTLSIFVLNWRIIIDITQPQCLIVQTTEKCSTCNSLTLIIEYKMIYI